MLMQATWNGAVLAESDKTVIVEGNHYFPPDSIRWEFFRKNDMHTTCPWKGQASYYDIVVEDMENAGGAWFYPDTLPAAKIIEDYIAFWRGVQVSEK